MAIVHDSYPFDPAGAGAALRTALDVLRSDRSGYGVLKSARSISSHAASA